MTTPTSRTKLRCLGSHAVLACKMAGSGPEGKDDDKADRGSSIVVNRSLESYTGRKKFHHPLQALQPYHGVKPSVLAATRETSGVTCSQKGSPTSPGCLCRLTRSDSRRHALGHCLCPLSRLRAVDLSPLPLS